MKNWKEEKEKMKGVRISCKYENRPTRGCSRAGNCTTPQNVRVVVHVLWENKRN
jgi:hypothetical protein